MCLKMKNEEHLLQVDCVNWFHTNYPDIVIFAIPNGGQRHITVAKKLKAEGVLAGVPDLFIMKAHWCNNSGGCSCGKILAHGFFIELKIGKNKRTINQEDFNKKVHKAGYWSALCYSLEEFQVDCIEYLGKGRGAV